MLSDPALPLLELPRFQNKEEQCCWIEQARLACSASLQQINALLQDPVAADRDIHSCLIAIRASLQLVLSEPLSAAQISATVRRALQVFERLASIQSFSPLISNERGSSQLFV